MQFNPIFLLKNDNSHSPLLPHLHIQINPSRERSATLQFFTIAKPHCLQRK